MPDSFNTKCTLQVENQTYQYFSLTKLASQYNITQLPYCLKVLLENLLRKEDGINVCREDILALLNWQANKLTAREIAFTPSRVILQDFTGVPAVVDLAAMRDAMQDLQQDPQKINPLCPVDLVIDHSVMVDEYAHNQALLNNTELEFNRNQERYEFLRWGQTAFNNFRVVPPGTGIVHQVNLEYLANVVFSQDNGNLVAYPDSVVGTDSHTTMINGLGVLGWGVGGIEAEAVMLGQAITMLIPEVIGFELTGQLPAMATSTDLVLTIVEMLRKKGVVGKFVEFYGEGLNNLSLADRATISNMAPEYGATCGIFPIDDETIKFLRLSGRQEHQVLLVEQYAKAQGLFRGNKHTAQYNDYLQLDLTSVVPCIAGPKRPQDRIPLTDIKDNFRKSIEDNVTSVPVATNDTSFNLTPGAVVIAAITSCTNTSNPEVMIAAGLLAQKAQKLGLTRKPWVKTSLAPGSQIVTDYLQACNLMPALEYLGFHLVGYGCTTCIGNSGPLNPDIAKAIQTHKLPVSAVLSGNRNFEGRIHPDVALAYLASPPLVVAYAIAGSMDIDLYKQPLGTHNGRPIFLQDIWPSKQEIQNLMHSAIKPSLFTERYAHVFTGGKHWQNIKVQSQAQFTWPNNSTYIKKPPYFEISKQLPIEHASITNARVLVNLGDSVTTDHISPAGNISENSPAGSYLTDHGIAANQFNSYGARRGNHEVMVRGTFANIRLQNKLTPDKRGGWTVYLPTNEVMSIYAASLLYQQHNIPLIVLAGKEYGTGSSRDWAAKGTSLLGVTAVIAESFERIHRSNLIGMGILPLQFLPGENSGLLGLSGQETFNIAWQQLTPGNLATVTTNNNITFNVQVRIDTPKELEYYRHGGILPYVLQQLAQGE